MIGGSEKVKKKPTGKWTRAGVPHRGWTCIDVYDDCPDNEEPTRVCEMCEIQIIRFVHVMRHREHPELEVGCVCAGNMQGDYAGARRREQWLKNRGARRRVWLKRKWRTSTRGNEYVNADGFNVVVFWRNDQWSARVKHGDTDVELFVERRCETSAAAKLAALDLMLDVRHERIRGFDVVVYPRNGRWTARVRYQVDLYRAESASLGSYETAEAARTAALSFIEDYRKQLSSDD
jgi:hypothetical protein